MAINIEGKIGQLTVRRTSSCIKSRDTSNGKIGHFLASIFADFIPFPYDIPCLYPLKKVDCRMFSRTLYRVHRCYLKDKILTYDCRSPNHALCCGKSTSSVEKIEEDDKVTESGQGGVVTQKLKPLKNKPFVKNLFLGDFDKV